MIIEQNEANSRLIKQSQYVACTEAFLDCRIPGSVPKSNYSLIGPGVTQNKSQVINLKEPHGFNIGAAAMPNGVTNNLHVHFTAEVFMCTRGEWLFRWGPKGEQGTYLAKAGDIVSIPTWIFRGFTNAGDDNGWLFTCLGGDNTGGVIWSPDIMRAANESGLYLSEKNELIDVAKGQSLADGEQFIAPFPQDAIDELRIVSPDEMATRISTHENRQFSERAFLDFSLEGHGCSLASVIGYGLTQDRNQHPPITNPHGFSLEFLKIAPGKSLGSFKIKEKMVIINVKGQLDIEYNQGQPSVSVTMGEEDTCSIPGDVWRKFVNNGSVTVEAIVIISGDSRKHPEFCDEVVTQAENNGWLLDANRYLVKKGLTVRNSLLEN